MWQKHTFVPFAYLDILHKVKKVDILQIQILKLYRKQLSSKSCEKCGGGDKYDTMRKYKRTISKRINEAINIKINLNKERN